MNTIKNQTRVYELQPQNGRKSFYGKAVVKQQGVNFDLLSYNTHVARWDSLNNKMYVTANENHLSNTTCSHIESFFLHCGKGNVTKKQLSNYDKL